MAAAPYVLGQAMLSGGRRQPRARWCAASIPAQEDRVADIGEAHARGLARRRSSPGSSASCSASSSRGRWACSVGDRVVAITPQGNVTPAGTLPRLKSFKVVGVFEVGMYEFDSGLALINIDDAQKLYRLDGVTGRAPEARRHVRRAARRARAAAARCPATPRCATGRQDHANFFRAVQIEKRVMFIILTLIVAVAAFNIVSAQVMIVHRQAGRHRDPAHAGRVAVVDHDDLHHPGRADRDHRHADRRGRRRAARAQHRDGAAGDRATVPRPVPRQERLLHQRPAVRPAARRRDHDRRHRAGAGAGRDDLPELAAPHASIPAEALRYE